MNGFPSNKNLIGLYAVVIVGTFLIMGLLVWAMVHYTRPAPVGAEKVAERHKKLKETQAADNEALNSYGWVNQEKGVVRLPIAQAMRVTLHEWQQNPVAARSNLVARAEELAAPPPKPPEEPSPYE